MVMKKASLSISLMAIVVAVVSGCVEHRTVYVQGPPPGATPPPQAVPAPVTPPPSEVVVNVPPPAPPQEVIVTAPGPGYAWTPGYYAWHGRWVWVRGAWVVRPRPHAVWVNGHWGRHGHGYVWVGGHWR